MSPSNVLEPTYDALRRRLLAGAWPAGTRLEAARIASDLGVSITPVRDSLNRLVGERIVHAVPGIGFQTVQLDETEFRELIEWHRALVSMAMDLRAHPVPALCWGEDAISERTAALFSTIAGLAGSPELDRAVGNAAARLGQIRKQEEKVFPEVIAELQSIELALQAAHWKKLQDLITIYHDRRRIQASMLVHLARYDG